MKDVYNVIAKEGEGFYSEKRSRFLSFALPVRSAEEAGEMVAGFRKKYHDARHVCWAYVLGAEENFRSSDDGEPSSTAGKPILGQIRAAGVSDVIVVVVRYFGGVELGTGGLAAAYRRAAADALGNAQIGVRIVGGTIDLTCAYEELDRVLKTVREHGAEVQECVTDNACRLRLNIRLGERDALWERLSKLASVRLSP
ncbi:MAG: YigZ family protein [Tannerellaceae bacterium]|nr:YigZ family protein [Tannerellaceae bacterium]